MRFYIFIVAFLLTNLANAGDSFITNMEYAKMLYRNPRGIGCDKCHGKRGEGKIIARYKVEGKRRKLISPPINNLSKELFFESFSKRHKIMPKYFLTYQEINALYFYVQSFKKNQKRKNDGAKKVAKRVRKSKKSNPGRS